MLFRSLRAIYYLLEKPEFEALWMMSTPEQQKNLKALIKQGNKENVFAWVENHPDRDLGEKSVVELREQARLSGLKNWSRLGRTDLILILKEVKDNPNYEHKDFNFLEDLKTLVAEMNPILEEAGLRAGYLQVSIKDFSKIEIKDAHAWLLKIYENEFARVKKIKGLLSPEMWHRYMSWDDFADHREVVLLKEALNNLKKVVQTSHRPKILKGGK